MTLTTEDRDALRIARVRNEIWKRLDVKTNDGVLPMTGLSVLDLAARTGAFSVALAQDGADVCALEGRESNLEQWPDVPEPVGARITRVHGDVRDLGSVWPASRTFDVVLCLGILYHLDRDDAVHLLGDVFARTRPGGIAIIDTHVGGHWQNEPGGLADPWGSIGNARSWWFEREELLGLLLAGGSGFTEIQQLLTPAYPDEQDSRAWFVATRGGEAT